MKSELAIPTAAEEILAEIEATFAERKLAIPIPGKRPLDEARRAPAHERGRGGERHAERGEERAARLHSVFRYSTSARRSASVSTFVHS
jgi:hypothetical protein